MGELYFSPEADEMLSQVEIVNPGLAASIHVALDRLEADPGDSRNRRRRFHTIGLWGIPMIYDTEEWLILWEPHEDGALVHHIVPAP